MTSVNCKENNQGYNGRCDNITIQARAASAAKPGAIRPPSPCQPGALGALPGGKRRKGVSPSPTPAGEKA